jgi:hypothetical protein
MKIDADFLKVASMGLVGVASLAFAPLETLLPPSAQSFPKAFLLIQPAVFVVFFAMLGSWAAPKLGLGLVNAGVAETSAGRSKMIGWVLAASIACALILILYARFYEGLASGVASIDVQRAANFEMPLITKLLYGGMSEEVICRWGLMTAIALIATKSRIAGTSALWLGNAGAALLFALGHLPLLFALMPDASPDVLGAVLLGNLAAGMIFGTLFIRFGLFAAMLGHAGAHLFSTLALMSIG